MGFKIKEKEKILEPNCEDFEPCFLNKYVCGLTNKCANAGVHCKFDEHNKCTGLYYYNYLERLYGIM